MAWEKYYDDADSIAHVKKQQAIASRTYSVAGVIRMLGKKPSFEDVEFGSVIDVELLDAIAEGRAPGSAELLDEVVTAVREKRSTVRGRPHRCRLLFAVIRLLGPECDELTEALSGPAHEREAAIRALVDPAEPDDAPRRPRQIELPASLVAPLASSLQESPTAATVQALSRISSDEASLALVEALENEELRSLIVQELTSEERPEANLESLPEKVFQRFEKAAAEIEKDRSTGLPNRVELVVAAAIAAISGPSHRLASCTLRFFDVVPGPVPQEYSGFGDPHARARVLRERLEPFCQLLIRSVDLLEPKELEHLASFLTDTLPERYPAAAEAWSRLDKDLACALEERWSKGPPKLVDLRRQAVASVAPTHAAPDEAQVLEMVRKAYSTDELREALEVAAQHGLAGVLREALPKMRESRYHIDEALEEALLPLVTDETRWLFDEELFENPSPERRAALKRVLERRSG